MKRYTCPLTVSLGFRASTHRKVEFVRRAFIKSRGENVKSVCDSAVGAHIMRRREEVIILSQFLRIFPQSSESRGWMSITGQRKWLPSTITTTPSLPARPQFQIPGKFQCLYFRFSSRVVITTVDIACGIFLEEQGCLLSDIYRI